MPEKNTKTPQKMNMEPSKNHPNWRGKSSSKAPCLCSMFIFGGVFLGLASCWNESVSRTISGAYFVMLPLPECQYQLKVCRNPVLNMSESSWSLESWFVEGLSKAYTFRLNLYPLPSHWSGSNVGSQNRRCWPERPGTRQIGNFPQEWKKKYVKPLPS